MVIFSFLFVIIWLDAVLPSFTHYLSVTLSTLSCSLARSLFSLFLVLFFMLFFRCVCLLLYHITLLSTVTAVMWPLMTRKLCERDDDIDNDYDSDNGIVVCLFLLSLSLSLSLVRFTFMYSCSFHASNRYHWVDFFRSPTSICSFTFFPLSLHSISTQRVHLCWSFRQKLWHLNQ